MAAEEAAVLAVFITLAVDGEERPFVKRANKTDAFQSGALEARHLQLETVKDIGATLLGRKIGALFAGGAKRADLVATPRASASPADGAGAAPALSSLTFANETERAGALYQFMAILEQVRVNVRERALAEQVALAVGATRIDLAMAQTVAQATGVGGDALTVAHPKENWYETIHRGVLKIVPEAFVTARAPGRDEGGRLFSLGRFPLVSAGFWTSDHPSERPRRVDVVSGTRAEHSRRIASFPRRYSPERTPTKAEAKLLAEFTTKEESNNGGLLKELIDDDPRGIRVPVASERIRTYVVEPLTRSVGFGVPNAAALQLCASHAPLVEVGAGTGYWAALLRARGVDVEAFDAQPPSEDMNNDFFFQTYTRVKPCRDAADLFFPGSPHAARALFLVWPVSFDKDDPPEAAEWDWRCLEAFKAAGGEKVVFVGERRTNATASLKFLRQLETDFDMDDVVAVPNWFFTTDDCSVWTRKAGDPVELAEDA